MKTAIVTGNSITLRTWLPQPTTATVIGTNRSWALIDPDVICCTQRRLDMPACPIYHSTQWTSSGVWATAWALENHYDRIWLVAMEGLLADQMIRRSVVTQDTQGQRGSTQHWWQDWHWLLHTQPQVLNRVRPVITRDQHLAFRRATGWQQRVVADTETQLNLDSEMVADTLE